MGSGWFRLDSGRFRQVPAGSGRFRVGSAFYIHPKKTKNRWSETEEKILIEVYGENEQRLKYKAYSFPEWQEVAKELRGRCLKQQVSCDKTPKQCKDKLANLTKKYKTVWTNCAPLA